MLNDYLSDALYHDHHVYLSMHSLLALISFFGSQYIIQIKTIDLPTYEVGSEYWCSGLCRPFIVINTSTKYELFY
jgi:hypothetical protein